MNNAQPRWKKAQWIIPSVPAECRKPLAAIIARLCEMNWDQHDIGCVHLALEEAITNAIKHGNDYQPAKQVTITARLWRTRVRLTVADQGEGFDPATIPDCTDQKNLERQSGRGVALMKAFMSRVTYNKKGNQVTMIKSRPPTPAPAAATHQTSP